MAKGIRRDLKKVLDEVNKDIASNAKPNSMFARGLASEGYAGGYRQALYDVQLALDGVMPNSRYWHRDVINKD